ncbi:ISCA2 [Branchiostoma lanceolatum]|uniref:Iron-sulfur cluster assembly 2 homolog, mitochondrial n=1 Tax=Branchiostoma lanceolatum TaxID=7740 RepID=A0A8J9ZV39_BRALA|nr:ISCA2 [Branchiostoma lanceolatum]
MAALGRTGLSSFSRMTIRPQVVNKSRQLTALSSHFWSSQPSPPVCGGRRLFSTEAQAANIPEELRLSDSCVKQLKKISETDEFLRVVVEGGGCSGFQYKFEMDKNIGEDDRVFSKDGVGVTIDKESLDFLKGSTIDYHEELIRSAFRIINNPNADHGCSCGASFSLKLD